jgi:hypothetical protein
MWPEELGCMEGPLNYCIIVRNHPKGRGQARQVRGSSCGLLLEGSSSTLLEALTLQPTSQV